MSSSVTFTAQIGKQYIVCYGNANVSAATYSGATKISSTTEVGMGTGVYKMMSDVITATSSTVTITPPASNYAFIVYEIG